MLILKRRIGQSIIVGDNIIITMLGTEKGKQVKIGITAPSNVTVHREEVYEKIKWEKNNKQNLEGQIFNDLNER